MSEQPKMDEAAKLFEKRKFRKAASLYKEIVKIEPENAEAYQNLARCLSMLKRNNEADKAAQRALELDPHLARPYSTLGCSHLSNNEFKSAEEHFKKAIELDSSEPQYLSNLGLALSAQGIHDTAIQSSQKAIQLAPENPNFHFNMSLVYDKQHSRKLAKEEAYKAFKLKPSWMYGYATFLFTIAQWPILYNLLGITGKFLFLTIFGFIYFFPIKAHYSKTNLIISIFFFIIVLTFWMILIQKNLHIKKNPVVGVSILAIMFFIWSFFSHWLTPRLNPDYLILQANGQQFVEGSESSFFTTTIRPPFFIAEKVHDLEMEIILSNYTTKEIHLTCSLGSDGDFSYNFRKSILVPPGEMKFIDEYMVPIRYKNILFKCENDIDEIIIPVTFNSK